MAERRLNRNFLAKWGRRFRYFYLRLLLVPDTPQRVARGLGVGVLVGFLPIIPLQTITAVALAWMVRGSYVASAAGTWVTNPITTPPMYALFFLIGRAITPFGHHVQMPLVWDVQNIMDLGMELAAATLVGGFVLGAVFAPLTYVLTLKYLARLQVYERRKLREKFSLTKEDS